MGWGGPDFYTAVYAEASLERVECADGRLAGLHLPEARLRDVRLSRVQAHLSLWFRADTRGFRANGCDVAEAIFRVCRLLKTDFSGAARTGGPDRGGDAAHRSGAPAGRDCRRTVQGVGLGSGGAPAF